MKRKTAPWHLPSYCSSFVKKNQKNYKNLVPVEPWDMWFVKSQPQTAHITQLRLKPVTHSFFGPSCINAHEDFPYSWFPFICIALSSFEITLLQHALFSVGLASAVSLLFSICRFLTPWRFRKRYRKKTLALIGERFGWKMIFEIRRQQNVLL